MKTYNTEREEIKVLVKIKLTLYLVTILLLTLGSLKAQDIKYRGFETGIGVRPISITSDLTAIDQMTVLKSGGNVGFFFGNDAFIVPVKVGFYYQAIGLEPRTFGILELEGRINYSLSYLLTKKSSRLNVYGIGGMNLQNSSFIGTYVSKEDRLNRRKRTNQEPVIGHQLSLNALVGFGVQWNAHTAYNYIAFFAEVVQPFELGYSNNNKVLSDSHIQNMTNFNIGIRVGR